MARVSAGAAQVLAFGVVMISAGRAKRKAKVELDLAVMKFQTRVERIATQLLERPVTLRLARQDQLRLLNLKFWTSEYKVSLRYILSVLLPYWENAKHIQRKKPIYGLGIRVATLIGARSRQVLEEQMQKDYPGGENEFEFRSELESRVALAPEVLADYRITDPRKLMVAYRARIRRARQAVDEFAKQMARRSWRGNPYR